MNLESIKTRLEAAEERNANLHHSVVRALVDEIEHLRDQVAFYGLTESERNKRLDTALNAAKKEIARLLDLIKAWGRALRDHWRKQVEAEDIKELREV